MVEFHLDFILLRYNILGEKAMSRILVTSIGSASAECVILSLKKYNHYIVGTNIFEDKFTFCSNYVDEFYKVTRSDTPSFIPRIIDICLKENINYIIPLTDVEIDAFNNNRELFVKKSIIICFSNYECIKKCRNKRTAAEIVRGLNICKVPNEIKCFDSTIHFPIIRKKINGRSSEGISTIYSYEDCLDILKRYSSEEFIYQEFIEGNVVTVDVLRHNGNVISLAREEHVRTSNGLGLSINTFYDSILENIVKKIADELDIEGCVNFEFIKTSKQEYYFLECNPRFSGGINFSILSGYDFVNNHFACFKDEPIENNDSIVYQIINRYYKDYIYYRGYSNE